MVVSWWSLCFVFMLLLLLLLLLFVLFFGFVSILTNWASIVFYTRLIHLSSAQSLFYFIVVVVVVVVAVVAIQKCCFHFHLNIELMQQQQYEKEIVSQNNIKKKPTLWPLWRQQFHKRPPYFHSHSQFFVVFFFFFCFLQFFCLLHFGILSKRVCEFYLFVYDLKGHH